MANQEDQLIQDILNLKNETLDVKKIEDHIIDFKSHIASKGWFSKADIRFSGRALLDPEKKVVTYWDMIKKSSSGLGGGNMGFSGESHVVKGWERSGSGSVTIPGGEKLSYDYGKVREQVRAVVEKNGWQLSITLIKPKWWKGFFS